VGYPAPPCSGRMLLLDATKTVDMPQVFQPFATDAKGQRLYETMVDGKFFLGDGTEGVVEGWLRRKA
jgi:hypothetical protein